MKRRKLILLLLLVVELGLLGLREWMKFQYPMSYKSKYYTVSYYEIEKYCEKLFKDRTDNLTKTIFWESDLYIGMPNETSEPTNKVEKLKFGNDIIPGNVVYMYNKDNLLNKIIIRTLYDANLEQKLISYYGEEHLCCMYKKENGHDRTWMTEDCFIKIGMHKDVGEQSYFLYIIIEAFEYTSHLGYYDEKKLDEKSDYTWIKAMDLIEKSTSSSKKSYSRKKKYGDSDVYQGSSKQAADLAAIDAYGANNPDFW